MRGMVEGSGSSIGNSPGLAVRNVLRPFSFFLIILVALKFFFDSNSNLSNMGLG